MAVDPLPKEAKPASRTRSLGPGSNICSKLPRVIRTRDGTIIRPQIELDAFVRSELDVSRLDKIEDRLWLAGRLQNIRPLHRQQVLGRTVIVTQQTDLHLLWQDDKIFIKPLPEWLLDHEFFQKHVRTSPALPAAMGFLHSYILLVSYEIDFIQAKELYLLPSELDWKGWLDIVQDLVPNFLNNELAVAPRYYYGELRLSRINWVYKLDPRFHLQHFCRGYHYSSQTYRSFINRNFGWLLVVFVYFSILLQAMQVGLGTNQLRASAPFNAASYGATVFSLVLPLLTIFYGAILSLVLVIYNVTVTLLHVKNAKAQTIGLPQPPKPPDLKV